MMPLPIGHERPSSERGRRDMISVRSARLSALAVVLLVVGSASSAAGADTTRPPPAEPTGSAPTPEVRDVAEIGDFAPLERGTYSIDPDLDPATALRVVYEIPAEGWTRWIGAAKFSDVGHVGVKRQTTAPSWDATNRS